MDTLDMIFMWLLHKLILYNDIANLSDYSTSEKVIGKWIDGKNIYQKTIGFTPSSSKTPISYNHGIANIDRIIDFTAFIYSTVQQCYFPVNLYFASDSYNAMTIDKTKINYAWYSGSGVSTLYVTIKYTKN